MDPRDSWDSQCAKKLYNCLGGSKRFSGLYEFGGGGVW
jgi:hypothetical protein